ncbi:unnamed protein product [Caenorhabditis angaria]|uniref:Nematode cuticle collagen N-terminal domain-containing protein n=1 Tax=Caenorhabditis angaria TaxID=860376 RepID=A0A9P1IVL7_9PELO|nr:unnamed protein product [Caenorhabditis angaria]
MIPKTSAYSYVLYISATISLCSIFMIFSTLPLLYDYIYAIKDEISEELSICKRNAQNIYYEVNSIQMYLKN